MFAVKEKYVSLFKISCTFIECCCCSEAGNSNFPAPVKRFISRVTDCFNSSK